MKIEKSDSSPFTRLFYIPAVQLKGEIWLVFWLGKRFKIHHIFIEVFLSSFRTIKLVFLCEILKLCFLKQGLNPDIIS